MIWDHVVNWLIVPGRHCTYLRPRRHLEVAGPAVSLG